MSVEVAKKARVRGRGKGFAAMTPEERSEIASRGGTAAQQSGRAHVWSREEAAEAGRKGGLLRRQRKLESL